LLLLQDDGKWYSAHLNKTSDEVNVLDGEYTASCRIKGGAVVAGNSGAKIESIKEYQNLLSRVFNRDLTK